MFVALSPGIFFSFPDSPLPVSRGTKRKHDASKQPVGLKGIGTRCRFLAFLGTAGCIQGAIKETVNELRLSEAQKLGARDE